MQSISPTSPFYSLYRIKYALLLLEEKESEEGVKILEHESQSSNKYNDLALYYLGSYYWANNKKDKAKDAWQQLVDQQKGEGPEVSPWVAVVKPKLDQIA